MHYSKNHTHYKLILSDEEMAALRAVAEVYRDLAADDQDEEDVATMFQLADKILKIK